MKISIPQSLRVFVVVGLMLAIAASMADAQQWGLPYTEAPFTPQMMSSGRWYIAGGARWRQGQKVSFDKTTDSGGYSVPFGPRVPGTFSFTPAGNNSGMWIYDNGNIDPNNPQLNNQANTLFTWGAGNTATVEVNPGDSAWANSSSLGAQVFQWTDPTTATPYWDYYNVGSFFVQNATQFKDSNNPPAPAGTFDNAKRVYYDLAFNPQGPTVTDGGLSLAFDNSFWCPYVEIGFWSGDVISIAYSFSGFSFSNSFQKNIPATFYRVATGLTDSYNFSSIGFNVDGTTTPNPDAITPNFSSKKIGTYGTVQYSYSINPLIGNRVFWDDTNGPRVEVPALPVTENLSVGLNANCYENRLAVLLMGRFLPPYELGISLGPVATLVHSTLNYQNIILHPDNPDIVLLTNIGSSVKDQWCFGAFGSLDLRVSLRNTFFGCSFDIVSYLSTKHGLDEIQSTINPGGSSLSFGGGVKF